jgi:hypothetical protein
MSTPISEFHRVEVISPTGLPQVGTVLSVPCSPHLTERRIYLYVEVKQTAGGAFTLLGNITIHRNGSPIGLFPASIGDFTALAPNQSIESMLNGGGSPVGDSIVLRLAQQFSVPSVTIQPLRVNGEIDEIRYNILSQYWPGASAVTGYRAYLGVLSTQY